MLAKSDFSPADALSHLAKFGLEAALIVPTPIGIKKSIMDATSGVRAYLHLKGYHDYSLQQQGQDHKVVRDGYFVQPTSLKKSNVSLYRPPTKSGDPRIWTGAETGKLVSPFNLLAMVVISDTLYILNMSDPAVRASLNDAGSPFRRVVDSSRTTSDVANELLDLLRDISTRGYIRTLRSGDTGVGMTLETLLGIQANSNRTPDYKGIELKAKRSRLNRADNRSTMFSKAPKWKLSPVGNAMALLNRRGYSDPDGRLALYHTLRGDRPNSLGLALEVDPVNDWLKQIHINPENKKVEHDTTWEMPELKQCLASKHKETFWVQAFCRGASDAEEFHYTAVQHTRGPMTGNLPVLIETGVVTVDYAMHQSGNRVRDHGYLFKIHPSNLGALFPPPDVHALC